jgi:hypothetical protein
MKRKVLQIAFMLAAAGMCAGALAGESRFSTDSEGWFAQGDSQGPLSFSPTGGNPGGHVFINDSVSGGVTYFGAPAAFLGNQSAAIGTALTFDLQQVFVGGAAQFDAADVVLTGGGLTLAFDTTTNPANGSWTSYAVPLTASAWHVGTLAGAAPTDTQFFDVMSSLTSLLIRAEYRTGADVGHLDNVVLQGSVVAIPEPDVAALLLVGLVGIGWKMSRRR